MAPSIGLRAAQRLPRALKVEWEDGFMANFSFVWLRDNSVKRPSLIHLDLHDKPENFCTSSDRRRLQVTWPPFCASDYTSEFLREHTRIKPVQKLECPITQKVLTVPWRVLPYHPQNAEFRKGATATLRWGECAFEAGTVWPQLERIPSLVTVEAQTANAKIHLVDGVTALQLMSARYPEEFRFLSSCPIDYEEDLFHATHPLATISDGRVIAVTFNNELRSAEIMVDCLDKYYTCLKTFHRICLDIMHTVVLQPGDVLVTDNHQTFLGAPAQSDRYVNVNVFS